MFPKHKKLYSYKGLVEAMKAFPAFAHTGDAKTGKREAAAFLANVSHETSGLIYINEQNKAAWPTYCTQEPYGCPAGQSAYHGRGPLQISWNYNYKAAGDAFHVDLLHHPNLAAENSTVTWKLALWYWMTQSGPGTMTSHHAMVESGGFGETIRSINDAVECNGGRSSGCQQLRYGPVPTLSILVNFLYFAIRSWTSAAALAAGGHAGTSAAPAKKKGISPGLRRGHQGTGRCEGRLVLHLGLGQGRDQGTARRRVRPHDP
ncbi:chitinase [Streptomyces sp. HUAS TT20]|uniref:chitinase n=1 Tax=Streptomyces sp. HUAS TT20 TaxID=3447509 RepID=UPI0039871AAC